MNSTSEVAAGPARLGIQAKLALAVLALCALAALFWPRGEASAPGGFLLDAGGRPTPLGPRLAPVTLVHFWATWCPPCIDEIPALRRLERDFAGQHDFAVVMVAVSDSAERVAPFFGTGSETMLYDPKWDVAHRYGTRQVPETYLVVRGKVLEKFAGATDWNDPTLRQRLASHLGRQEPAPGG
jgi:thiol-disulfide isomerase/thioredoxin